MVTPYGGSKGFLHAFMKGVALEQAPYGVRANCVCPGTIDTPMLRQAAALAPVPAEVIDTCIRMHPMGRIGTPEEVANVIAFLASDWASFITGTSLMVDGGLLIPTGGMGLQESGLGTAEDTK